MNHESVPTTWSNTSTSLGGVGLVGFIAQGSADQTTFTIKDGTATKLVPIVATTALAGFLFGHQPIAFRALSVTVSGTGSYSIIYYPRP